VRFRGKVHYVLNREVPREFVDHLDEIVEELNERVLAKGIITREEGAKIVNYELRKGKVLALSLETGKSVRIDDASLRIRNWLVNYLGKFYRVGVREVILKDGIIELEGELRVSLKLPFVKSVEVKEDKTLVLLADMTESELKRPLLLKLIRLLHEKEVKAKWSGKAEHWYLIKQSKVKLEKPLLEDPNDILERVGWIKRFLIRQWVYTPPFAYLINMVKSLFLEEVVKPLGFVEVIFPKIYPVEVGLKTGHLKGVVNSMLFASLPGTYDISEYEELIDYMSVFDEVPREELARHLRLPSHFLCFAQCEPFYQFLSKEIFNDDSLPVKWYDHSGPSFRWEAGGLYGVERLIEFHRVEVVWLGLPKQVLEIRDQLLKRYEVFMDEVLNLEWRWAWVTPWYLEQEGVTVELKEIDLNRPGTIDFEVWLPYKGSRNDKKSWLEVGNISVHGTKFTSPFKIKHNKGKVLWTGCSGFGIERWTLGFLAQKGFNPENWPKRVQEYIKRHPFPKSLKAVTIPRTKRDRTTLKLLEKRLINP